MTQEEKAKAYDDAIKRAKRMFSEKELNYLFPEIAESDDESIRKEILNYIDKATGCKEWVAWLKKQEFIKKEYTFKAIPRLLEMIQPTDRAKSYCQKLIDSLEQEGYSTDAKIVKNRLKIMNGEKVSMATMDDQKPDDKDEPKFKVGDWVVSDCNNVAYIESISETKYNLQCIDGSHEKMSVEYVDRCWHLWTIQDAKDGDVLVHSSFMFDDFIFIYNNTSISQAYCYYPNERNRFIIEDRGHQCPWNMQEVTPATKEQRDQLKKAMTDAGYTFDFDKKELKEIEDEEYNDEDYGIDGLWHAKNILEKTLGKVDGYQTDDGILDHKCAISAVNKLYKEDAKIKNRWKPIDEHIHWLKFVIKRMPDTEKANEAEAVLKDLLEQLEEL